MEKSLRGSESTGLESKLDFTSIKLGKRNFKGSDLAVITLMYIDIRETGNITTPLFGIPGGANLDFNDSFAIANIIIQAYNNREKNPIPDNQFALTLWDILKFFDKNYGVRLEPNKVFYSRTKEIGGLAANGYAQATGMVGRMFATSGPGATNQETSLGESWADSKPVMAIWGQTPSTSQGRAFQEGYALEMSRPTTKYSVSISDPKKIPTEIIKANYIAKEGRPGAVTVELPVDIAKTVIEYDLADLDELYEKRHSPTGVFPSLLRSTSDKAWSIRHWYSIDEAVKVIQSAKRPVLLAGGGVVNGNAAPELREFVELNGIPVLTTLMALGVFPSNHPLCVRMPGTHGAEYANETLYGADVVIAAGARLENRVITNVPEFLANGKRVIQIDVDRSEIGRHMQVIPICRDVKDVLRYFINKIRPKGNYYGWHEQISKWKKEYPITYDKESEKLLASFVIHSAFNIIPENAVVSSGVGAHQMLVAQHGHHLYPRRRPQSGGFGTMGYGLPAAIGYAIANPGVQIWDIDGDGSFIMTEQVLGMLDDYKIPIKTIIIANGYRIVGQWQDKMYDGRRNGTEFNLPDFAKLAEAYHIEGINVSEKSNVESVLRHVHDSKCPIVAAFYTSRDEILYPWIPGNEGLSGMIRNPLNVKNR